LAVQILDATNLSASEQMSRVLCRDLLLLAVTQDMSFRIDPHSGTVRCLPSHGVEHDCPIPANAVPDIVATLQGLAEHSKKRQTTGQFLLRVPSDLLVTVSQIGEMVSVSVAGSGDVRATVDAVWEEYRNEGEEGAVDIRTGIWVRRQSGNADAPSLLTRLFRRVRRLFFARTREHSGS
jgi:hypothetical protein